MSFDENKSIESIFSMHYNNILQRTMDTSYVYRLAFELLPAMFIICDLITMTAKRDRNAAAQEIFTVITKKAKYYDMTIYEKRISLYTDILRGKPLRCEWCFKEQVDMFRKEPAQERRCMFVLGDILFNPPCADGYDTLPLQKYTPNNEDKKDAFFSSVMEPIYQELKQFSIDILTFNPDNS